MIRSNNFAGGSNGTAITSANSGGASGDAFNSVQSTDGGTPVFVTSGTSQGALAGSFPGTSTSGNNYVGWTSLTATDNVRFRAYLETPVAPGGESNIIQFLTGTTSCILVCILANGTLRVRGPAGILGTATVGIPTDGTQVRVELYGTRNATTGAVRIAAYLGDSTTEITNAGLTLTGANTGAAQVNAVRFGAKTGTSAVTNANRYKAVQYDDSTSQSFIGPAAANTVPTASAGTDKDGSVGTAISLTGTDADSDGTVVARQWSVVSVPAGSGTPTLTNPTLQTVSFTPAATGVYTLQYQVTDNAGANSAASQAKVYVAGLVARPLSTVSNTGPFSNTGGAASIEAALADEVSSTYAESQNTGTSVLKVRLSPMQVPTVFNLKVDHLLSAAGSGTATVKLYKGATTIKTWTLSPTTSSQQTSLALTSGEIASVGTTVSDWRALDVEITWAV